MEVGTKFRNALADVELICQLVGPIEELVLAYCLTWPLRYEPGKVCVYGDIWEGVGSTVYSLNKLVATPVVLEYH